MDTATLDIGTGFPVTVAKGKSLPEGYTYLFPEGYTYLFGNSLRGFLINKKRRLSAKGIQQVHKRYKALDKVEEDLNTLQALIHRRVKDKGSTVYLKKEPNWVSFLTAEDDGMLSYNTVSLKDRSNLFLILKDEDLPLHLNHEGLSEHSRDILFKRTTGALKRVPEDKQLMDSFSFLEIKRTRLKKRRDLCQLILCNYAYKEMYGKLITTDMALCPGNNAMFTLKISKTDRYHFFFDSNKNHISIINPTDEVKEKDISDQGE